MSSGVLMVSKDQSTQQQTTSTAPDEVSSAPTVTFAQTLIAPFLRLAEQRGPEFMERVRPRGEAIIARWGLSARELEADPMRRIPIGLGIELLGMLRDMSGDPALGLRAGASLQSGDYEVLEYLCGSCPTLREAIHCLSHFYPLLTDVKLSLVEAGDLAEVHIDLPPDIAHSELLYEFATVSNFTTTLFHLDLDNIEMPVEFRFAHAAPDHADAFAMFLPAPVRFGCKDYASVFQRRTLDRRMTTADAGLHRVLRRQAEIELAALPRTGAFAVRVRDALEQDLQAGASLETVAERLHMSASNLRRKLKEQGTTFSDLLESTRRRQAQLYLRDNDLTAAEIAQRLGFAHPPAFHRAFKRWFGRSVAEYRNWVSEQQSTRFWRTRRRDAS